MIRGRRVRRPALPAVCALAFASGCYTLVPVATATPPLGATVGLHITDAGRVALGGTMGPEIEMVEGRLVRADSQQYVVAVRAVHLLRGGVQTWSGERVTVRADQVARVEERKFSRGRTAAIIAAGVGMVAAIATQSLIGGAAPEPGKGPPDSSSTVRIPWP